MIHIASIAKRGDSYRIRVYECETTDGKQRIRSMTWTPEPGMTERQIQKELNRQATLFEERIRHGSAPDSRMKFKDFCELWFKDYAEQSLKPRTLQEYKNMTGRVYTAIGHIPLDKLRPTHLIELQKQLMQPGIRGEQGAKNADGKSSRAKSDKPLAPKTVQNYMTFVSSVLGTAVRWEFITSNPAAKVQPPRAEHKRVKILDDEQIKTLITALETEPTERRALLYLAIFTGMRRGEMLGLQWDDVDFEQNTIRIDRTIQYTRELGVYVDTPKTAGSRRVIKTSPVVINLLRTHRAEQHLRSYQLGDAWKNTDGWVFTTWDGKVMHPSTPYKFLQEALKKAGLEPVSLHSLRHSNATLLINSGASLKAVSSRLGHSNVSTTANIYAEAIASADAAAAAAIDEALIPKKEPKAT